MEKTKDLQVILHDERGFLFKGGRYVGYLLPGEHYLPGFTVEKKNIKEPFSWSGELSQIRHDEELLSEVEIFTLSENELAIHILDGRLIEIFQPGSYAYWKIFGNHSLLRVDKSEPHVDTKIFPPAILNNAKLSEFIEIKEIQGYQKGLLYYDGIYQRILDPGKQYFWRGHVKVDIVLEDTREQQLDLLGRDVVTKEFRKLRANCNIFYKVIDPVKFRNSLKSPEETLKSNSELFLKEFIFTLSFAELNERKESTRQEAKEKLAARLSPFGVEVQRVIFRDWFDPPKESSADTTLLELKNYIALIGESQGIDIWGGIMKSKLGDPNDKSQPQPSSAKPKEAPPIDRFIETLVDKIVKGSSKNLTYEEMLQKMMKIIQKSSREPPPLP